MNSTRMMMDRIASEPPGLAAEKALGEAAQVKRERDAFEKKLKRRKLFGEVLAAPSPSCATP